MTLSAETYDLIRIGGLIGLSAVQILFGLAVGRLWRGRSSAGPSKLQTHQAAQSLTQVRSMAGELSAQAGQYAQEIETLQSQLSAENGLEGEQLQAAMATALAKINQINRDLQEKLSTAESRLEQQARQIESHLVAARTDVLTGLHNRRAFDDELNQRVNDWRRQGNPASLMLLDVDHFKRFNDSYGHPAGDEVLRGVARVLYSQVREDDMVCRYGGEEFAIILPGQAVDEAQKTAERVRAAVEATTFSIEGRDLNVTISGGLTQVGPRDTTADLVRRADEALYASKAAGRNCAHRHDGSTCEPLTPAVKAHGASTPSAEPAKQELPSAKAAAAQLEYRDKQQSVAEVETDSRTDALTGLPNQRAFSEDLRRRIAQWRRFNTPLSIVLADVDFLADINRDHGREIGDIVLRAVTQFFNAAVREMDVVARYHGDEFVLMLPGTVLDNGVRAAERIRNAISMCKLRLNTCELTFTVSAGVAEASSDDDAVSLLARASTALEASKANGFNQTHVHNGQGCCSVESAAPVVKN